MFVRLYICLLTHPKQKKYEKQVEETEQLKKLSESRHAENQSHSLIISELKENIATRKEESALLRQQLELAQSDAASALRALEKVVVQGLKQVTKSQGCYLLPPALILVVFL